MQGFGSYEPSGPDRLCYRPPVPPFPRLDEVWKDYQRAAQAVDALDRALTAFPVPDLVGKLFARLDAVHSSGAEGTTTTFSDLMEFESSARNAPDVADAQAVANCAEAFDEMTGETGLQPTAMARRIHKRLFEASAAPYLRDGAGEWKSVPNATFDEEERRPFHYTHPASIPAALKEWDDFSRPDSDASQQIPALVRQSLSHWMFEHIHPFADGNGRVGRLLVPLLLKRAGATRNACAFMGEAVHANKGLYIGALKDARRTGDLGPWTRVCLSMVRQTAEFNLRRLHELDRVMESWRDKTKGLRAHSTVHQLLPFALARPVFTVNDAARDLKVSYQTANAAISQLAEMGIVRLLGAGQRDRLFETPDVLKLFAGPPGLVRLDPSRPLLALREDQFGRWQVKGAMEESDASRRLGQLTASQLAEALEQTRIAMRCGYDGDLRDAAANGFRLLQAELERRGLTEQEARAKPSVSALPSPDPRGPSSPPVRRSRTDREI